MGDPMKITALLIANRGEIAIRIARAAAELRIATTSVFSEDDAASLHVRLAAQAEALPGRGPGAYLDGGALIAAARRAGCDAIHPGYGFLSENAAFAAACADAGLAFVGPSPATLARLGDKAAARELAARLGVPVLPGTKSATTLAEAATFLRDLGPGGAVMLKALSGGGGRGMRIVTDPADLADLYARCASEAKGAFGAGELYVEQFVPRVRHIEVQVIGDGRGAVSHLGERDCTLQRRRQKLVEFAPAPGLAPAMRQALCDAAVRMAQDCAYAGLGTFEFLVDAESGEQCWFIEANPRVQVEHTVTEQVTGIDLVQAQIRIAQGETLAQLGLSQDRISPPRGMAVQLRVNMEDMDASGEVHSSVGRITAYEAPSGPGVRVDGYGYVGYATNPAFDPLLAKLVFSVAPGDPASDYPRLIDKAARGLRECRIEGVGTNLAVLQALLAHPAVQAGAVHTGFIDGEQAALAASAQAFGAGLPPVDRAADDPAAPALVGPPGSRPVIAPMVGVLGSFEVEVGQAVRRGQLLAILDAMKMEHTVVAEFAGIVRLIAADRGAALAKGAPLMFIEPADVEDGDAPDEQSAAPDATSPALADVIERHALLTDARRPRAVARRRKSGQRTVRENIAALCDPDSFVEYGGLMLPAQRRSRTAEDMIANSPTDGLVAGVGRVNGADFEPAASPCMVLGYDYTVFAGTQSGPNHRKMDRMLRIAAERTLPVVLFAEGGGGRSGESDTSTVAGLDIPTFAHFARLSGHAPVIGVVSGFCFAGNAALLGCADVIIATENASIGMGGPAMIEGGGLGVHAPEDVGPVSVQAPNGVVDVLVADEAQAVDVARRYLSYFQGCTSGWSCIDQARLRHVIPDNRLRVYDVRRVIDGLADIGSVLELRPSFGVGLVTALVRIEGRPLGVIANDPRHLSGAIDSAAADKGARFLRLCDTFGFPVVSLCDTPGFMVGPDSEKTAAVRHVSRLFMVGANLTVPLITVVLRKAYGLGAMAMAGGGFHETLMTLAWPTGEFGGMGLEGSVRLGSRRELEAIADPEAREARYRELVGKSYEKGKALNAATFFEFDDVIDPAETRGVIAKALQAHRPPPPGAARRPYLDPW